jgi:hypothetical protein
MPKTCMGNLSHSKSISYNKACFLGKHSENIFPFPRKEYCTLFIKLFQGIKCPAIGHPANGRRENSNFGTGMEIVFICDTGYELIGNITLTCNLVRDQGVWSSQKPSCRSKTLALFFFFL